MQKPVILILLILGILLGVYLVTSGNFKLFSRAEETVKFKDFPVDPIITNVTDTSFTISYFTPNKAVPTEVVFTKDGEQVYLVEDDRGSSPRYTHHVALTGLEPNTEYFAKIKSDDEKYPKNEYLVQSTAGPASGEPGGGKFFGSTETSSGGKSSDSIAYLKTESGQLISVATDPNSGDWRFDLSTLRTKDFSGFYQVQNVDPVDILIVSGTDGVGLVKTMGYGRGVPLKIISESERVPFYRMQLGEPVSPGESQSGQGGASDEDSKGGSFFDAIWVWVRKFFGQD